MKKQPEKGIIIVNHVGLSETVRLAGENEESLKAYYPAELVDTAMSLMDGAKTDIAEELKGLEGTDIFPLGKEGFLAGLWFMAEEEASGLFIDMKKVPIRQETVEICEALDINPYEADSTGAILIITDRTLEIMDDLNAKGVKACLIGRLSGGKARILKTDDRVRYLDKPRNRAHTDVCGEE